MKKIGEDSSVGLVICTLHADEWDIIQRACGIPYDKRRVTDEVAVKPISRMTEALADMKTFRKELGTLQKKWDSLASRIDFVLSE